MDFQIVEVPQAAPAVCRACGGASKDWYLDTGHSEEYYGAVIYCCECIAYIADLCGFLIPAKKEALDQKIEELEQSLFRERVINAGMMEVRDAFDKLGVWPLLRNDVGAHSDSPGLAGLGDETVSETSVLGTVVLTKAGDGMGDGEGTSSESSDDKGLAKLRTASVKHGGDGVTV